MKEQLSLLSQLQAIDNEIDQHESELSRFPLEAQEIARNLVVLRRDIAETREKLASTEKELRKKEQDMEVEQEKIKRSERRLLNIKNQKEHNALSREIKLGKKVTGEIEEAVLSFMSEAEGFRKSLERKEKEYAELEKSLLDNKARAEVVQVDASNALKDLNSKKDKVIEGIERDFLKRYHVVKKARGNAVVELVNGSCTGCHMAIPPQLNIRVLKQEEIVTCPNCHRILYVKPENIPEFNKIDG